VTEPDHCLTAGIDLSLTATGVARSDGQCGVFGQAGLTKAAWSQRLLALRRLRREIVEFALHQSIRTGQRLEAVVIEGLDMAQSYGGQIERATLWSWVVLDLHDAGTKVYVAPSPQVKMYATGKGSLPRGQEKKAVQAAVREQWPFFQIGNSPDKADAAAMCALAREIAGQPFTQATPAQLRALEKTLSIYDDPPVKVRKPVNPKGIAAKTGTAS
jgi:hypothetical protein